MALSVARQGASRGYAVFSPEMDEQLRARQELETELQRAMERGEIQANSAGISTLTVSRPHLLKDEKVRILVQYGLERHPAFPGVPTAIELAATEADRELWRYYAVKYAFARPIALPPEVPAERVKALQDAFDKTMKDPEFLGEAQRARMDVNPMTGAQMESFLRDLYATPRDLVDRAAQAIRK